MLFILTTIVPAFNLGSWQRANGEYLGGTATIWALVATIYFGVPALRQARAEAAERNRPMVAMELRLGEVGTHSLLLVLRNYGLVVARWVHVSFDPELPDPSEDEDPQSNMVTYIKRRYARPIPTLTPGQELVQVYCDVRPGSNGALMLSDSIPLIVRATVSCEGPDGSKWSEVFDLAADVFIETTWATSSTSLISRAKQGVEHLKKIEQALRRIDAALAARRKE